MRSGRRCRRVASPAKSMMPKHHGLKASPVEPSPAPVTNKILKARSCDHRIPNFCSVLVTRAEAAATLARARAIDCSNCVLEVGDFWSMVKHGPNIRGLSTPKSGRWRLEKTIELSWTLADDHSMSVKPIPKLVFKLASRLLTLSVWMHNRSLTWQQCWLYTCAVLVEGRIALDNKPDVISPEQ